MKRYPNAIKDVLGNCAPNSGASLDYARGCLVGVVSTLMLDLTFENALKKAYDAMPNEYMVDVVPQAWREQWTKIQSS